MKYLKTLPALILFALSSLLISNYAYATDSNCDCNGNKVTNSSFETISDGKPTGWTWVSQASGATFGYDDDFEVCGSKNALLYKKGYVYQDVAINPNHTVSLKIWGGYHNAGGQKFELIFLKADKSVTGTGDSESLNKSVTQGSGPHGMTLYNLGGVAPADAAYARIKGSLTSDYLKIDQVCLTTTAPPVDCNNCANNVLKNPSFETISSSKPADWTWVSQSSNPAATFGFSTDYEVCGSNNAILHYKSYVYQDAPIEPGFTAVLKIWAGYHVKNGQKFDLIWLDGNKGEISVAATKDLDKSVTQGSGPNGMTLYTLTTSGGAPANAKYLRVKGSLTGDYLKIDQACLVLSPPNPGCSDCTANKLVNPSFETTEVKSGVTVPTNWVGSNFISDAGYVICGSKNGLINNGAGSFYQDVNSSPGDVVTLKIWAGYHVYSAHKLELIFLSSNNTALATYYVNLDKTVESLSNHLKFYTLTNSSPAPAGTVKVRVKGSASGNYFKVDFACLTIKENIPPVDCSTCTANVLKNNSFETTNNGSLTDWTFEPGVNNPTSVVSTFGQDNVYNVCGTYNGLMHYAGKFYQDVPLEQGFTANLKIWGGYHVQSGHKFQLIFLNASKNAIGTTTEVALNKRVEDTPKTEPHGMTQYTLSATAPAGAKYVRVQGVATGDYFKVDFGCLTLTPPPSNCDDCAANKLANPSFELTEVQGGQTVPSSWIGSNFVSDNSIVACGQKDGMINNSGYFYQDITTEKGAVVTLKIWGAYDVLNGQKFMLIFYPKTGNTPLSSEEVVMDKSWPSLGNNLKYYEFTATAPAGTEYVRVGGISSGNVTKVDFACLTIVNPTPPLPVTLSEFRVVQEQNTANLAWTTVSESNAQQFEVQHSGDGKQWINIGSVAAKGESTSVTDYNFVHNNPIVGNNLYRLKMIDVDNTFAFSKIVNLNFNGEGVSVFPNPTTNRIKLNANGEQISKVQLYNVSGVVVMETKPDSANEIDLSKLTQGTYIVRVHNAAGLISSHRIQIVR